jgi:hypothetical protein
VATVDLADPKLAAVRRAADQAKAAQAAFREAMIEARRYGHTYFAIAVAGRISEKTATKITKRALAEE